MASTTLRFRALRSLADLLSAGVGWTVAVRGSVDDRSATTGGKRAIVALTNERTSESEAAGGRTRATVDVAIRVLVDPSNVPDGENPYETLDDAVGELELVLPNVTPDPSGTLNVLGVRSISYDGHRPDRPDEETGELAAVAFVTMVHEHDLGNPSTLGGITGLESP